MCVTVRYKLLPNRMDYMRFRYKWFSVAILTNHVFPSALDCGGYSLEPELEPVVVLWLPHELEPDAVVL